jgi:hypothetical protein
VKDRSFLFASRLLFCLLLLPSAKHIYALAVQLLDPSQPLNLEAFGEVAASESTVA